jgi:ubiquinone/menaquinone biosynthesis C-methylase UbiE
MEKIIDEMRLGKIEYYAMNNPIRRFLQKKYEFSIFKKFLKENSISLYNKNILDAGCGSGYSTELIIKTFIPCQLKAFDYMPEQINLAKRRKIPVSFYVGDMTNIQENDLSFDAVFVFGVIHHIPLWKKALKEIYRVLKKEGVLLIEEPLYRFTWHEFENELINIGFKISKKRNIFFSYFRSYCCIK